MRPEPQDALFTLFAAAAKVLATRGNVIGHDAVHRELMQVCRTEAVDVRTLATSFGALAIRIMLDEVSAEEIDAVDVEGAPARWLAAREGGAGEVSR